MLSSWQTAGHIKLLTTLGMWIRQHGHVNLEGVCVVRLGTGWIDLQQCKPLYLIRDSGVTGAVSGRPRNEPAMQDCVCRRRSSMAHRALFAGCISNSPIGPWMKWGRWPKADYVACLSCSEGCTFTPTPDDGPNPPGRPAIATLHCYLCEVHHGPAAMSTTEVIDLRQ
jgi:hypothetical protein